MSSLRRFLRALFSPVPDDRRGRMPGEDLAENVRDAMGPLAGGKQSSGRASGSAVYRHCENNPGKKSQS